MVGLAVAAGIVKAMSIEWGGAPDATLCGPMERRIAHLADVILRQVHKASPRNGVDVGDGPLPLLTRADFRKWAFKKGLGFTPSELHEALPIAWARGEFE